VRELRQELRISLARTQRAQILPSRLLAQQAAVTRASERLNEARSKLADAQTHQTDVRNNLKRFEDALIDEQNPAKQKELRDRINVSKAELEDATYVEQCQTAEIEAEQQLRPEQDKLNALETQLDELVKLAIPASNPVASRIDLHTYLGRDATPDSCRIATTRFDPGPKVGPISR
jgi:hypothetical protein